jgi:hypothetical protein
MHVEKGKKEHKLIILENCVWLLSALFTLYVIFCFVDDDEQKRANTNKCEKIIKYFD